ncbi:p24 complex component [Mortierella antarctica]|nr:p24 complex component [Mortierella antarctica]
MATYKQRPYQRHTAIYSDDDDAQTPHASSSGAKQASNHATAASTAQPVHLTSHLHQHYSNTSAAEDEILENTSDREWTSVRNLAGARAKARRQQYLDQQQQRTREWQFVLNQHSLSTSQSTAKGVSSDDYDEILSSTGTCSMVTSPHVTAAPRGNSGVTSGEQSSVLGYSDLTSDGLESVGESEDLGVWSHDDEEFSIFAPKRRLSVLSSPHATSSTTSLSNLPRPSFASPHLRVPESKFQNQMPFHDGSGNFTGQTTRSHLDTDLESSDLGWESSSSRASSALRSSYRPKNAVLRRRISSSEFQAVIQNIADLQHTSARPTHLRSSRKRSLDAHSILSTDSQPLFMYPHVVAKRPIFNIYESEMEDLADMVMEMPTKIGWLEAFERALRALHPAEYCSPRVSDPSMLNPIKQLALHLRPDDVAIPSSKARGASAFDDGNSSAIAESAEIQEQQQEVKQNMSAASFETLQRLQTRKRSNPHHRYLSDPMQVEFSPTVGPTLQDLHRKDRRVLSRSTGTSTSSDVHDTNLLEVVISTLRRFRDHVKSNILYSELYDGEEGHVEHLSRSLGVDGDLGIGIEWSAAAAAASGGNLSTPGMFSRMEKDVPSSDCVKDESRSSNSSSTSSPRRDRRSQHSPQRRRERTASVASSGRSSSYTSVRRVSSDCGMESMKQYRNRDPNHPIHSSHHSPSLVELMFFSIVLLSALYCVAAFNVGVPPQQRRCLFEMLDKGDYLHISFQLTDPNETLIHDARKVGTQTFFHEVKIKGKYEYCLSNSFSAVTEKKVVFNVYITKPSNQDSEKEDPLANEIRELAAGIQEIKNEQEYAIARERSHRNTAESTNARVVWWSLFQSAILFFVCVFQIMYLKRFFVKRVV